MKKWFFQKHFLFLIPVILFLFGIFKLYYDRVGGFSFGDEYNNFVAGYFMVKGRTLFSEIFFNHQILMAQLSFLIQKILQPDTLYKLVLYHRGFVLLFSCICNIILAIRFREKALGVIFFYEILKYYFFGHLFLAESLIVYPLLYLFFLCFEKISSKQISAKDIVLSGILTWFIVFMREPFVPLALLFFGIILAGRQMIQAKIIAFALFVLFSILLLISVPVQDFYELVIRFNFINTIFMKAPSSGAGIQSILFYPIYFFFNGKWNFFRYIILGLDSIFLFLFIYSIALKKYKECLFIFISLALAAIRNVIPGFVFFEAFHMTIWYGLFSGSIFLLLENIYQLTYKKTFFFTCGALLLVFLFQFSPQSYIWEKINKNETFTINYARHYINGEVIRLLSNPHDTLFADTWDYLLFWQAGIDSSYPYGVYTFVMVTTPKYRQAKESMFRKNPPAFYYTFSPESSCKGFIPDYRIADYVRVYSKDKQTCLFMKKEKISKTSLNTWKKVHALDFSL